MVGIGGCRSSGVLGSSAVVSNEGAKLISIHAAISISGGDAVTVKAPLSRVGTQQEEQ